MPDTIDKEASQDDPTSGIARALSRTERDYRRLRRGLVALLALAVVVILVILLWAAREQNLQHARHTHEQIETQLEQIRRRLIGQVLDYATWDLSHLAIHADDGPDLEWLELEMGSNLHDNLGIDLALLVSTDQEVLYEVHRGEPRRPPATDHGSLLAQSRLAEAPMTSGFALWQERPVLFATAPVLPESSHHVQAPSPHRLLFAFEVDNGLIGILREATNLPDLHLTATPERPGRLPLRTRRPPGLAGMDPLRARQRDVASVAALAADHPAGPGRLLHAAVPAPALPGPGQSGDRRGTAPDPVATGRSATCLA